MCGRRGGSVPWGSFSAPASVSASVAACPDADPPIEEGLACFAFPLAHRARIRTTNGVERLNEEIRRRTRVVRLFPHAAACLRLVTALCVEQSEEWVSGRYYLDMRGLCPRIAGEGVLMD